MKGKEEEGMKENEEAERLRLDEYHEWHAYLYI